MEDTEIVALFFDRSEQALRELDRKYGGLCHGISYGILHSRQDAEECVSDAYLKIWNAIPPNRPRQLVSFLCRIVRNVSISRSRSNLARKRRSIYDVALEELESTLAAPGLVEDRLNAGLLSACLARFLAAQTQENRVIFLRRYWFADEYREIAQRTGLPVKTVSVRLTRMRRQLRAYLEEQEVL